MKPGDLYVDRVDDRCIVLVVKRVYDTLPGGLRRKQIHSFSLTAQMLLPVLSATAFDDRYKRLQMRTAVGADKGSASSDDGSASTSPPLARATPTAVMTMIT